MNESKIENGQPTLQQRNVISRFFRWFKISCPKCKTGKLTQDDIHHCWGGGELNVYTCDKCKSQFV